jgi:hypothetical protein
MSADRYLDLFAGNLADLLGQQEHDPNWFVNLVITAEQLRGAADMATEPVPATVEPLLREYERAVDTHHALVPPGLRERILAAVEALLDYAATPAWRRDEERGDALLCDLADAMRFATGLRRAGIMNPGEFEQLAGEVAARIAARASGLFDLLEPAASLMDLFGADRDYPEGQAWLQELADLAPSTVAVRSAARDPDAIRNHRIRQAMKHFRAGTAERADDVPAYPVPVGSAASLAREASVVRLVPRSARVTGHELLGRARMAAADSDPSMETPREWPIPAHRLTVRLVAGSRTPEGRPAYLVQVEFDEPPARAPRLVWVAGKDRFPLEPIGRPGTRCFEAIVDQDTLGKECRLMLGRRRLPLGEP